MNIAQGILDRHRRYGWTIPPGEWGDINANIRSEYHSVLDADDPEYLVGLLETMFGTRAVWGLVSYDFYELRLEGQVETFTEMMGENLAVWMASTDATAADLHRLRAPMVGRPLVAHMDGVPIMYDTARHDHYAQRICNLLRDGGTVLEIGGGYGGMALQVLRSSQNIQIVICDIPETLYLAWYWLTNATTRTVAWYDDDPEADVVLLPAHERDQWDGRPDMVVAAHSLSEFTAPVVGGYLAWIHHLAPRYFYHDNAHLERVDVAAPEVLAMDMVPGPPYREVYRAPTLWPTTGGRYWEFLFEMEAM